MCPSTFSKKHTAGRQTRIPSAIQGQRCLGSSLPSRFPAALKGWQGYPPDRMSTFPRKLAQGKVLTSVQIGAASRHPASILATRFAQANASISLKAIVRRFGIARLSPRSMPPYPAQRLMCVTGLVVSMSCVSLVVGPQCGLAYKAKLFPLVIFRVRLKNQNRSAHFPDAKMFPGQNSWGKLNYRNCPGRFPKRQMFRDRQFSGKKRKPKFTCGIDAALRVGSRQYRQRHRKALAQGSRWPQATAQGRAAARAASPKKRPPPKRRGLGMVGLG